MAHNAEGLSWAGAVFRARERMRMLRNAWGRARTGYSLHPLSNQFLSVRGIGGLEKLGHGPKRKIVLTESTAYGEKLRPLQGTIVNLQSAVLFWPEDVWVALGFRRLESLADTIWRIGSTKARTIDTETAASDMGGRLASFKRLYERLTGADEFRDNRVPLAALSPDLTFPADRTAS